jgi:hypothetical protein
MLGRGGMTSSSSSTTPFTHEDDSSPNPLFSRLQGLFPAGHTPQQDPSSSTSHSQSSSAASPSTRPHTMHHSLSEPSPVSPSAGSTSTSGLQAPEAKPRKAIKVLIVTWNMADSLVSLQKAVRSDEIAQRRYQRLTWTSPSLRATREASRVVADPR